MSTRRNEAMVIAVTLLALSAGAVAGMVASRFFHGVASASPQPARGGALAQELDLTPKQADQIRQVWEAVRENVRASHQSAERLGRQRDQEIAAILTDQQKAQFEKITRSSADRFTQLRNERDQAFARAVAQTRNLLNADQRQKYDQILASHLASHLRPEQLPLIATPTSPTTAPTEGSP
jgi:Spy/CpxP family protein refolding chaperone